MHEESKSEAMEYINLQGMRYKYSHLKSLSSSSAWKIDYL